MLLMKLGDSFSVSICKLVIESQTFSEERDVGRHLAQLIPKSNSNYNIPNKWLSNLCLETSKEEEPVTFQDSPFFFAKRDQ